MSFQSWNCSHPRRGLFLCRERQQDVSHPFKELRLRELLLETTTALGSHLLSTIAAAEQALKVICDGLGIMRRCEEPIFSR